MEGEPLTLSDWADIARIVTSLVSVAILAVSAIVAFLVYRWQRAATTASTLATFSEQMRHFNLLLLNDSGFQKLEAQNHPWGRLTEDQVVLMYRYFILLNVAQVVFTAHKVGTIEEEVFQSHMKNFANMTFDDREFIKRHCFPRGYARQFRAHVQNLWTQRDIVGTPLS